jgi:hypothetical protein
MSQYLIPTDKDFVNDVAKAIARTRWARDATIELDKMFDGRIYEVSEFVLEQSISRVFETMWNGTKPNDEEQRENYRNEAVAVISAINLKLLTTVT